MTQSGLAEAPIARSAAPIPFTRWLRARDGACAALLAGESRVAVIGAAGTGKTMLVDDLAQMLRFAGWHVTIHRAGELTPLASLERRRGVLLVDDADRLSAAELGTALGVADRPILLAGQEIGEEAYRAGVRVNLAAMGSDDAHEFVALWLARAGCSPELLAPPAVLRIVELSAGIPHLLANFLSLAVGVTGELAPARDEEPDQSIDIPDCGEAVASVAAISAECDAGRAGGRSNLITAGWRLLSAGMIAGRFAVIASLCLAAAAHLGAYSSRERLEGPKLNEASEGTVAPLALPEAAVSSEPPRRSISLLLASVSAERPMPPLATLLKAGPQIEPYAPPSAQLSPAPAAEVPEPAALPYPIATTPISPAPDVAAIAQPSVPDRVVPAEVAPVAPLPALVAAPVLSWTPVPIRSATMAEPVQVDLSVREYTSSVREEFIQASWAPAPEPAALPPPATLASELPTVNEPASPFLLSPATPNPLVVNTIGISDRLEANPPAQISPSEPIIADRVTMPVSRINADGGNSAPQPPLVKPAASNELTVLLLRRGQELLALGDISAARRMFSRAAEEGSPAAMLELGRTYDPGERTSKKNSADPEVAMKWYQSAARAGNAEAAAVLQRARERPQK